MTKTLRRYLILRSDGSARVTQRIPYNPGWNEIAFSLHITLPSCWGEVAPERINLTIPEGLASVQADEPFAVEEPAGDAAAEPSGGDQD